MNENYRELKRRIRKLDEIRVTRGMQNIQFVRALDLLRRAAKRGDSDRNPSPELTSLLDKAEALGSNV